MCVENQNLTILGSYTTPNISYISATISACKNTSSVTCAPKNEIINYVKNNKLYWSFFYTNSFVNLYDYANPIGYKIDMIYKLLRFSSFVENDIFIKQQVLDSDDGILLNQPSYIETYAFDYADGQDSDLGDNLLFSEFNIYVSPNIYIYHRAFKKIQEILASVGGLAKVIQTVFGIICATFSIIQRNLLILNKIFEFDLGVDNSVDKLNLIGNEGVDSNLDTRGKLNVFTDKDIVNSNVKNDNLNLPNINLPDLPDLNNKGILFHLIICLEIKKIPSLLKHLKSEKSNFIKQNSISLVNLDKSNIISNTRINFSKSNYNDTNIIREEKQNKIQINNNFNEDTNIIKLKEAKRIIENLNSKKNKLSFSFCEVILGFICCNCCSNNHLSNKKKLYGKINSSISQFFDITYIILKLEEFEKFKVVMLKSEQLALFNFISRELISLDEDKLKNREINKLLLMNKNKENLARMILEFRDRIKMNMNMNMNDDVDKKLLELLNENFK